MRQAHINLKLNRKTEPRIHHLSSGCVPGVAMTRLSFFIFLSRSITHTTSPNRINNVFTFFVFRVSTRKGKQKWPVLRVSQSREWPDVRWSIQTGERNQGDQNLLFFRLAKAGGGLCWQLKGESIVFLTTKISSRLRTT